MLEATLLRCAQAARRRAERLAKARDSDGDLCGLCGIASAYLASLLRARGLEAEVVVWSSSCEGHCYVECGGYLVDVTSTQFGRQKVELHPLAGKPKEPYWQGRRRFATTQALRTYLRRAGWPDEQIPVLT